MIGAAVLLLATPLKKYQSLQELQQTGKQLNQHTLASAQPTCVSYDVCSHSIAARSLQIVGHSLLAPEAAAVLLIHYK